MKELQMKLQKRQEEMATNFNIFLRTQKNGKQLKQKTFKGQ
jgi:hypothetical protein